MPNPITRGAPRDWRVAPQSPVSASQFTRRARTNETLPCQCPGCTSTRAGVSRYCGPHRTAASKRGDPVARIPTANELAIFRHAVKVFLAANPVAARKVERATAELERRMYLPPSFQLRYSDMHRKLPRVAKAKGLLANWYHARGKSYGDATLHALALTGWMAVFYDGLPENRTAFLRTCAGGLLGDVRLTPRSRAFKPRKYATSGATKRDLGVDFLRHANETYGVDFWSSPVTTEDGQSMSLLSYTKLALRAAGLLS